MSQGGFSDGRSAATEDVLHTPVRKKPWSEASWEAGRTSLPHVAHGLPMSHPSSAFVEGDYAHRVP